MYIRSLVLLLQVSLLIIESLIPEYKKPPSNALAPTLRRENAV